MIECIDVQLLLSVFENYLKTIKSEEITHYKIREIKKLAGDASARIYYRLFYDGGTCIGCLDKSLLEPRQYSFQRVQQFLRGNSVRVPEILFIDFKNGVLLLEDLGNVTFLKKLSLINSKVEELSLYQKAIDIIILMQKITNFEDEDDFTKLYFDKEKFFSEIQFTNEYFLKRFLKLHDYSSKIENINNEFLGVLELLGSESKYFVHRDFHSRNIMVKNDELIVIDFQDARLGTITYDLVSLLEDCYYSIDQSNKQKLLSYYWEKIGKDIFPKSREDFDYTYELMAIQRIYKAIGSFCFIYYSRGDFRYLKYIGYAMEGLRKFLLGKGIFSSFNKILLDIYYES